MTKVMKQHKRIRTNELCNVLITVLWLSKIVCIVDCIHLMDFYQGECVPFSLSCCRMSNHKYMTKGMKQRKLIRTSELHNVLSKG